MIRYYVKRDVFWQYECAGRTIITKTGRPGTSGTIDRRDYDSEEQAQRMFDWLCGQTANQGYVLTDSLAPPPIPPLVVSKAPQNIELENAIAENSGEDGRWLVYADWLLEQGEPWGEVIAQGRQGTLDEARVKAVEASLLGDSKARLTWKGGVIWRLDAVSEEPFRPEVLERILNHPSGRFVRQMILPPDLTGGFDFHMESLVRVMVSAGPLPLLEKLDLSRDVESITPSFRRLGDARGIWSAAPHLREFLAQGSSGYGEPAVLLAPIHAPHLERFVFKSGGLSAEVPEAVGAASLPELVHLELWFGRPDYGCTSTIESLKGILEGSRLPKLKTLGLKNSEWEAELIKAVAKSPLLRQLDTLDFSMGVMASEATAALLECAQYFKHLKTLTLDDNFFSDQEQAALLKQLPNATFGLQKGEEEAYRYTTVGE